MPVTITRRIRRLIAVAAGFAAVTAAPALAENISSGTIDLSLNITNACVVNGAASVAANLGSVGSIQFPDQPGIFGDVDGQLGGALNTIQVLCSPGVTPSLKVGSGLNDAAGKRRLAASGNRVAYRLFSDAGRQNEINVDTVLALGTATTTPFSVPIFARVNSAGLVLPAGHYTDTVSVTLSW